jgi:hypothetical protein
MSQIRCRCTRNTPKSNVRAEAQPEIAPEAERDTLWLRVLWFCIGLGIVCRFAGVNWDNARICIPTSDSSP